jgi:hypothetical protein
MSERRYSDDEVALILRKATETAASTAPGRDADGLTLEDLKGIGREVGIDAAAIEAAARHVAVSRVQATGGFFGVSATPRYEATVSGEIPLEKLSEAVAAVRRAMGRQGVARAEFGGLEWQARDMFGGRYVSLQPSGGRTHVRVFGNFRDAAFLSATLGGIPIGAVSAAIVGSTLKVLGLSALLGVGTLPVGVVAGVAGARLLWKRLVSRETRALERTASELEWALKESAGTDPGKELPMETEPGEPVE